MLERTVPPPFVKTSSFNLITPEETKLPNGITLFFVPGGFQDVLKIEFILQAGRWFEEKAAAAYFTAQLLPKGTPHKTSFDIAQIFDRYGAHLEISPGQDFVSVSLYALSKKLSPVLELLVEIFSEPVFPLRESEQAKSIFIQNLRINREKTSFLASQALRKNLFGAEHPYGAEVEEKHVKALRTEDFQEHFSRFHHSAKVFVSGKIEPANRDLISRTLLRLKAGQPLGPKAHIVAQRASYEHVEKKESVQSSVRMGKRSLLRPDPDYVPVLFVSHILGGYFGSRLMKNIREEKGLTYGISASVHGLKHDSYLAVGADVNKENAALTFDEIRKELYRLRTTYISSGELETTRNHFIGSLQSEITTPFAHAEKIKTIALFNLQPDHYQKMIRRIDAMTAPEVARVSDAYFHEDSFIQVAVG